MSRSLDKTQLGNVSFCHEDEGTRAKIKLNLSNKKEKLTLQIKTIQFVMVRNVNSMKLNKTNHFSFCGRYIRSHEPWSFQFNQRLKIKIPELPIFCLY